MILLACVGAALIYAWGLIVPFIVSMLANTLTMLLLAGAIIGIILIAINPRTHLVFKLAMRALTSIIVNIDPIGVLKERCLQMMKRLEEFYEHMKNLRGAQRMLIDNIERNDNEIQQQKKIAANARRIAESPDGDETNRIRAASELRVAVNEINRLENSNRKYKALKDTLDRVHKALERASVYLEGHVKDSQNQARHFDNERKALKAGSGALAKAVAVFRGKADENDVYNMAVEKLADDASMMLGEMEENLRWTEEFMAKVDLQTGTIPDDALKMLNEFEQKMLPPAAPRTTFKTGDVVDADYAVLFKKEGK